ncbi:MAG TPA: type IV pilus assembly protein PilM [Candidatus Goldiibacteriota bacterium]|nr:type IV pilus assembly protein PilM [Candidatus Goldiibacteriota bacterium]
MALELFSQSVVGLDIGSSSIKAVKLKKGKEGYELVGAEIMNLTADSVDELEPDVRFSLYVNTIKKILSQKNIASKKAVTAIPGDNAIIRYIKVPYMTAEELKNMVPYEAEQYIPLGMDQVVFDYSVLSEAQDENQKKMEVLLVAVKNDTMNQHLEIIKAAGITPHAIDVDAFAMCNAYSLNAQDDADSGIRADTVAIINIGAKFTMINILEKGVPHLSRDVNIGGNNFTKEIQREFGLNFAQAEELKKQQAVIMVESDELLLSAAPSADDKSSKIFEAITPSLNKLLNDIRRAFDYYESTQKKKPVQKILLSGGSSKIKNIDRFLSERLGIPVEINYPFKNISINSKNFDFDYLRANAVQFNVALGLALRMGGKQ